MGSNSVDEDDGADASGEFCSDLCLSAVGANISNSGSIHER